MKLNKAILVITPLAMALLMYLLSLEQNAKKRKLYNSKTSLDELNDFFEIIPLFKKIKNYIAFKLSIVSSDINKNFEKLASAIMIGYFALVLVSVIFLTQLVKIWYISILAIIAAIGVPIFIFNLIFDRMEKKIMQELPDALEELSVTLKTRGTLVESIEESLIYMPKKIRKEFEVLAQTLRQDNPKDSVEKFINRIPNRWMKILGLILLTYIEKGGDLSPQLEYLNDSLSYFWMEKEKTKNKMFMPKVLLISMIVLIPGSIKVNASIFPISQAIYFTDSTSITLISVAIISVIVSFMLVLTLEKM